MVILFLVRTVVKPYRHSPRAGLLNSVSRLTRMGRPMAKKKAPEGSGDRACAVTFPVPGVAPGFRSRRLGGFGALPLHCARVSGRARCRPLAHGTSSGGEDPDSSAGRPGGSRFGGGLVESGCGVPGARACGGSLSLLSTSPRAAIPGFSTLSTFWCTRFAGSIVRRRSRRALVPSSSVAITPPST